MAAEPAPPAGATQDDRDLAQYRERLDRPIGLKADELQHNDRLRHVIFSGQFTTDSLAELCASADRIRLLSRSRSGKDFLRGLLAHNRAMLYFTQPSTRTFLSFMAACQVLGITCNEVRDPQTSSETKGETRFDSIRMFSSYFDLIIMRSPIARLAESCAYLMNDLAELGQRNVPIINAGSGADEHPTQALLDIYTLMRTFQFEGARKPLADGADGQIKPGLAGKTYAFCGDIGRGRTVRSLAMLLANYPEVRLVFVAPEHATLRMGDDLRDRLTATGTPFEEVDSFESVIESPLGSGPVIEQIDALYMTRVQKEHDTADIAASYAGIDFTRYCLSPTLVGRMREHAPILHPFPRNQHFGEIPTEIDRDPRAMYFRQARNGMWARAALLASMLRVDREIAGYYADRA